MKRHHLREFVDFFAVGLTASAALVACGTQPEVEESALASSAIWNGTPIGSPSASLHVRGTVRLRLTQFQAADGHIGTAICSGTLLRSNVVLTARHCVTKGELLSTYNQPGNIYVYNSFDAANPPTCNAWNCARGATIVPHPDYDVALVFLARNVWMSGSVAGHAIPVLRHDPERYEGRRIQCTGYGNNAMDASGNPTGAGVLRSGWPTLYSVNSARTEMMLTAGGSPYQLIAGGDSGGPCWSVTFDGSVASATYPHSAVGVARAETSCVGGAPCFGYAVAAPAYRRWVRSEILARLPQWDTDYYYPYLSSSAPHDNWSVEGPALNPAGCPSNWVPNSGSFTQTTNCYGTYPDGPRLMHTSAVVDNAIISTRAWSQDNDAAGIVFRYVDSEHYYLYLLDQARASARMYKRTPAGFQLLDSESVSFSWQDGPTIEVYAYENHLYGNVPGKGWMVSVTDSEYPVGRIGLYDWALEDVSFFDGIEISHLAPGDNDW